MNITESAPTGNPGAAPGLWWKLVRFGFRLLYNEMAWTYDAVSYVVSLGQWRDWVRTSLRHLGCEPGADVLEVAHGTGNLLGDLLREGFNAVGLDLSPAMGRIARRKLLRCGLYPNLVRGDAARLPFRSGIFDAVVSTFPTEFIIRQGTLSELARVLRPGGRLVIVFGGILTGHDPISLALEWAYRVTGQRGPLPVDDVDGLFEAAGFKLDVACEELPRSQVWLAVATKVAGG